jgi:hypothetical protein
MMPRTWRPLLRLLFLLFLIVSTCHAGDAVRVNEAATKVQLHGQALLVWLGVENSGGRRVPAHIEIELIDPKGQTHGKAERDQEISTGSSKIQIEVAMIGIKPDELNSVFLYRVRYTVAPSAAGGAPFESVTGILSVSEIAPEMFKLEVAHQDTAKWGAPLSLQEVVRAVQPATSRPVGGVKLEATLDVSGTEEIAPLKASATTDSQGYATLKFLLPAKMDTRYAEVQITGERDGFTATIDDAGTGAYEMTALLLDTDKALYQPGQIIHARVLAFGPDGHAAADKTIELRAVDPDNTLVFKTSMKTSKFGIASADWPVPANQRLGTYSLRASFKEEEWNRNGMGQASVKISRYELPNFVVTAKPDRTYYLPDQSATVEVRGDYLFGQRVTRGHVRVVRENGRQWNYAEQKWDVHEGESYEGDTDATGRYVAKIDLAPEHKDFADDQDDRFGDYSYTAYFTDPTSGRTEQRRFDLRLTKDPIHIYVISPQRVQAGNVVDFYLSTYYADGTPAPCTVTIRTAEQESSGAAAHPGQLLRTIHTNHYGVAKISGLAIPTGKGNGNPDQPALEFHATDVKGASGTHTEEFYLFGSQALHVETDKTLYSPGDPIVVHIGSGFREATAEVEVFSDWRLVASQAIPMLHGRGEGTFAPNDKFQGDVTIVAFQIGVPQTEEPDVTWAVGWHTVLFPHDTSLKLDVHMSKATYRPGEEADADFHLNSAGGGSAKGALGLVVVDKAVEEHERTDEGLSSVYGFPAFRPFGENDDDEGMSGVHYEDLNKVDLSKPLPEGFELVAEILLQQDEYYVRFGSPDSDFLEGLFSTVIDPPLTPVIDALKAKAAQGKDPGGEEGIRRFLDSTQLANLRDPWGTPYRVNIQPNGTDYDIDIESAGPDKKFDTRDDFSVGPTISWPYFQEYTAIVREVVQDYHRRTGAFIRDAQTLNAELLRAGLAFDSLRDPWGHAYRVDFGIQWTSYTVRVTSAGPDGKFDAEPGGDDIVVSASAIDYFGDMRTRMDAALESYYHDTGRFPQNEKELEDAFRTGNVGWDTLRDAWGHPYYATFGTESRYSDTVTVQTYAEHQAGQHMTIRPVTLEVEVIHIRSNGPDGKEGTRDDFDAAAFTKEIYERQNPGQSSTTPVFTGEAGAISGTVTDTTGGVISGTTAMAVDIYTGEKFQTETTGEGSYLLHNLKPGLYSVTFIAKYFKTLTITEVPVNSSAVTTVDAILELGPITTTVNVLSILLNEGHYEEAVELTSGAVMGPAKTAKVVEAAAISTPRLREYFPETLVWQPELDTDSHGTAHLTFPLADSVTTWKLEAIASTVDGRVATAEKEVRAFQPFFADEDLPQFLTAGDKIGLPVIVRNYLDHAEQVDLKLDSQPWQALLGASTQHTEIAANDSSRVIFSMRAETSIKDGKERVTATGKGAADAIEKKTTVRPFGEEMTASASQIFGDSAALDLSIPRDALRGSVEGELKIYPNLMAHVWEAMEAILQRPYGCAEQTISSVYPGILLLRYAKQAGREESPEVLRARRYAQMGYDQLLSFVAPSGGFTYWGRGDDADPALTAYALMFLHDAKDVIPVDDSVGQKAQMWLLNQMKPDGHWVALVYGTKTEDPRRSALLTAYIARALAISKPGASDNPWNKQLAASSERELASALTWLGRKTQEQDEPYLIASYALALVDSGVAENRATAEKVLERLQSLAHTEGDTAYWELETNTPFYGWGLAGRLETTGLVVEALERGASADPGVDRTLIDRGTLFLLRNQDRYGIWYSTQATVNVLRALASSVSTPASVNAAGSEATVLVDGKPATTIALPPANELSAPVMADLSNYLGPGEHRVEISRAAGAEKASVQLAGTYYVPWNKKATDQSTLHLKGSAEALRLAVTYDKTASKIGEQITCTVKAERVDFRGYGMMLAEIGLPPGAEVDRASLDKAMTASGWDIEQYDVLPDRVIVYLWPRAGGTTFSFAFKTRFGINAETTRSVLYDYYNPDAQAVVAPTRLVAQ